MSYDLELVDESGSVCELTRKHNLSGGTVAVGGTDVAELNITYNYAKHFQRVLKPSKGGKGIRSLYGMTGEESIPVLMEAISLLGDDVDKEDYWTATEGNAKEALEQCLALAQMCPKGVWQGD